MITAIRAVTTIPTRVSIYVRYAGELVTYGYIDLQYDIGSDLHLIHPYYQDHTYSASPVPAVADFSGLENRAKYVGRDFISEMGVASSASSVNSTFRQSWFNHIGQIGARPKCHGAVMFCLTDFWTDYSYGIYNPNDASSAARRPT